MYPSIMLQAKLVAVLTASLLINHVPVSAQEARDQIVSPSANVSTSTSGGTNINYQTNNSFNNEFGFAPGIFCRTPCLYLGGGAGNNSSHTQDDPFSAVYQDNLSYNLQRNINFNAQIGLVYPFGSSVIEDCKSLTRQIAVDRRISTELSMIRACAALEKEGLKIDPQKYPLLAICLDDKKKNQNAASNLPQTIPPTNRSIKIPATTRL
jgi:hypothetical protein